MPPVLHPSPSAPARRLVVDAPGAAMGMRRRTYRYLGGPAARVADVMTWPAIVVHIETPIAVAQRIAEQQRIHYLPAVDCDVLAGIVCLCDLEAAPPGRRVKEYMRRRIATVTIGASLDVAKLVMAGRDVGCLPVTAAGFVCGIVTRGDLVRAGALDSALRPACVACGGHHHVSRERGVPFCPCCLERGRPVDERDPYEEVGTGD